MKHAGKAHDRNRAVESLAYRPEPISAGPEVGMSLRTNARFPNAPRRQTNCRRQRKSVFCRYVTRANMRACHPVRLCRDLRTRGNISHRSRVFTESCTRLMNNITGAGVKSPIREPLPRGIVPPAPIRSGPGTSVCCSNAECNWFQALREKLHKRWGIWPSEVCLQGPASNHPQRHRSKVLVVSVEGKGVTNTSGMNREGEHQ